MKTKLKNKLRFFSLLKETYKEWNEDDPFRHSAVIAYYAIFSLPALLIIVVKVAGLVLGKEAVQGQIEAQISGIIGHQAAEQVQTMIANSSQMGNSIIAIIIGVATLLFGATGVFYQLQQSLNKVWEVQPKPNAGISKLAIDRATSLGIILAIGFLLLIFMVVTTSLNYFSEWIKQYVPDVLMYVFYAVNILIPLGVITVLFALIFKVLPDAKVSWRSVWVGAFVTAILFTIGKFALGIYFGKAEPASTYGVAGSVILMMLWVNYSALILLFGAEFTQVYARSKGHRIEPSSHAQRTPEFRLKEMEHAHEETKR